MDEKTRQLRFLPRAIRTYLARLVRALGDRIHSHEDEPANHADVVASESAFACVVAMFRRAAEPLDAMHPDLAQLLTRNVERDATLNERLTELSYLASAGRARAQHFEARATEVQRDVAVALARAEAAESAARASKQALSRLETRYMEYCASALKAVELQDVDDTIVRSAVVVQGPAPETRGNDDLSAAEFHFRLTG